MKLWQKTYLSAILTCTLILYICMFIVSAPPVAMTLETGMRSAKTEERAISNALEQAVTRVAPARRTIVATQFLSAYEGSGLQFRFSLGEETLYSTISMELAKADGTAGFIREGEQLYLFICDRIPSGYGFLYLKNAEQTQAVLNRQLLTATLTGTGVALFMAVILYILLYRVNLPVSRLAHEMRTPLTVMRGYAETIRDTRLTDEQRHMAASYIADESRRLSEISSRLLTMHNKEEITDDFAPVDLKELFTHLQKTYPEVSYEIGWGTLIGDRAMLSSLLSNLIENAAKASDPGSLVELRSEKNRITVTDHGRGLTDEELAYLNSPPRLRRIHAQGGIGIPLCHQIAKAHGAQLRFTRMEDGGTQAEITFYNLVTG